MAVPVSVTCRICGQVAILNPLGYESNAYEMVECARCETVMTARQPDAKELSDIYDRLFDSGEYEQHRREFEATQAGRVAVNYYRRRVLARLERLVGGRHLLEIGGGTGAFGHYARSRGWDYVDYDISPVARGFAARLGLVTREVRPGEVPNLPKNCADAIVMWEVIEHVWNVHEYIVKIRQALRPGGLLALCTPNFESKSYQNRVRRSSGTESIPPVHINFFKLEPLRRAIVAAGLEVLASFAQRIYRPDSTAPSFKRSVRMAMGLEAPRTLFAIGRAPATS